MRINRYIAQSTGLSRRAADTAVSEGRVKVDGRVATLGQSLDKVHDVQMDGRSLQTS